MSHSVQDIEQAASRFFKGMNGYPAIEDEHLAPTPPPANPWPSPLSSAALVGLPGEVVQTIEPTTESDPAAILMQFLAFYGNVIGRGAYWQVEDTRHYTNLFVTIVGETAVARKGTSLQRIKALFAGLDPEWERRHMSGLSSGEGVIWAVRDPITESVPQKEKGKITGYEEMETDPGIGDKRLLVLESEFARVLSAVERQGNTLSPVLRDAWDGNALSIMTKAKAARCEQPHITLITHISKDELLRMLNDTSVSNGFLNRYCLVCARRSKHLPFGGDRGDYSHIREQLMESIESGRQPQQIALHADSRVIWEKAYGPLSDGRTGMLGAVTARATAHVLRIATLYALLGCSRQIYPQDLLAAFEVWRYCEESAGYIFGDAMGDPTADAILEALRREPDGMTRTDLRDFFQKNKKAEEITRALMVLQSAGKAYLEKTPGVRTERWFSK